MRRIAMAAGVTLAVALLSPTGARAQASPLARAHAHNDYEHPRPLLDALSRGFNGVEADIWLVDGELLVAHDRDKVRPGRTLESLYLEPLRERVRAMGGRVHPGVPPLLLLIDIKSEADATYAALDRVLRRYADILAIHAGGATAEGPALAVISGNRPRATLRTAPIRFAAFDGRLADLAPDSAALAVSFMPLVSDRWDRVSQWSGEGRFPDADRQRLLDAVRLAHAQGRRIRFWGAPDNQAVWKVLWDAGVDLINTDDLDGLRAFLLRQR